MSLLTPLTRKIHQIVEIDSLCATMAGISLLLMPLLMMSGCQSPVTGHHPTKPLVIVELTSLDCSTCPEVHRIVQDLSTHYDERMTFFTVDVSESAHLHSAIAIGKLFHGESFMMRYYDRPGTVAVIQASTGRKLAMWTRELNSERYYKGIEDILAHPPSE